MNFLPEGTLREALTFPRVDPNQIVRDVDGICREATLERVPLPAGTRYRLVGRGVSAGMLIEVGGQIYRVGGIWLEAEEDEA